MDKDKKGGENLDPKIAEQLEKLTPEEIQEVEEAEEFINNFNEEDLENASDEDKDKLKDALKKAKTTINQKRHFRDKLKKLEEGDKKPDQPIKKKSDSDSETITKADETEFRLDTGFSKDVIKEIADYARSLGITLQQAAEKPAMKALIKEKQDSDEIDNATYGSKKRAGGGTHENGNIKDWSTASREDIIKHRNKIKGIPQS